MYEQFGRRFPDKFQLLFVTIVHVFLIKPDLLAHKISTRIRGHSKRFKLFEPYTCTTFSFFCTFIVNPIALRKAKIVYNFGLSQCNRVKEANSLAARICAFTTLYKDGTEGTCYWDKGCASCNMQKRILNVIVYANSKGSNQPAHLSSLITTCALCLIWFLENLVLLDSQFEYSLIEYSLIVNT